MDWTAFTLFLYILMRMTGFVLFNPLLSRRGIPGLVRAGFILVLTISAAATTTDTAAMPGNLLEFALKLLLELGLGFLLGFVVQLFFYIPQLAGHVIDNEMGMTMASTYDPGSQVNMTVSSTLLNVLMTLLFFAANGHYTMIRILLSSSAVVPYAAATLGPNVAEAVVQLFIECTVLGVKLALPILAAEFMGQVGMGILMKVIPQINVFAINIELKVVIGLIVLLLLITPISAFLLEVETQMLASLQQIMTFVH